jgi:hypothetical protein
MKNVNDFKDFLDNEVNLNQSRIDKLDRKVEIITTLLKDKLNGYKNYSLQGSYAHRTIIKPVKDNHEFDADILVFIRDDDFSPDQFTDYVKEIYAIFQNNDNYKNIAKLNTRCVTIDYVGDFHLDVVPCIKHNGVHYICNRTDNKYEVTDGNGYKKWLTDRNSIVGGNNFIKTTKLFKFLRGHKGNFSAKSILLTTLLGNQVNINNKDNYSDLPTTLKILSNNINDYLQQHSTMPTVCNPVLPSEDFNRHWDQTKYSNFRKLFSIYNSKINKAFDATNRNESIKKWRELFGDDFGKLKDTTEQAAIGAGLLGVNATKPYAGEVMVKPQMPSIAYEHNDFSLLNNIFPDLYYDEKSNTIKGELSFSAHYKNTEKKGNSRWKIFPCTTEKSCLKGYYEIEIDLNTDMPTVYETSKKIQNLAKKLGKSNNDLHLYDNHKCCLGVYIDTNILLSKFIINHVYPYFVWQAYFEKYCKVPPCGEYPHNREKAEIEYLVDRFNSFKNLGANDPCPCKSGKKYKRCHGQGK